MSKQFMSLLAIATLACGFTFADENTVEQQPVIDQEIEQTQLSGCGCGKPGCGGCKLADCGCGKKKKTGGNLAADETQQPVDDTVVEESVVETLACENHPEHDHDNDNVDQDVA